jgi:ABC-type branched-subunit amino acid transport system ATPase component/ABC-type branched-subunit amino acid transport system permease subunit
VSARVRHGLVGAATAALIVYPLISHDAYWQNVLFLCLLFAVLATGWNMVSGYTGYASLGQGAFLGFGAYCTALLAIHTGASVWWFVPVGGLFAAFVAALLGLVSMRTRGHAFVIMTIALIYIAQLVAQNWASLTQGSTGLTLPITSWPREWQNTPFYYVMLLLLVLSVALSWAIRRTKFGMGLIAIREDEGKAVAIGVNGPIYKILAFVASAVFVGMAGGVYAYALTFIDPSGMFDILFSVQLVLAALIGGRGTLWGPVIGGFAIELLDEGTNNVLGGTEWHVVVFGVLMVLVVLFLPRGLLPTVERVLTRRRDRGRPSPKIELRPSAAPRPAGHAAGSDRVLLDVRGLRKSFGGVRAVDDLSFYVREGTITALIGPNGSGKTTAFNLIHGMMRADAGEVRLDGRRIDRLPAYRRAHLGLGRTFQITRLFAEMTVLENVVAPLPRFSWRQLAAGAMSGAEADRARELLDFVGMLGFADRPAGALSFGQQKLIELAQTLMLDPKLILLDEPSGGVNPTLVERIAEKIVELNARGKTFLIVEHNMPLVAELCDPVIVLERGRRIAAGPATDIQRDPLVLDAYLGTDWSAEPVAG